MEEVLIASKSLIQEWAPNLSKESSPFICSNNTKYGELFFSRKVTVLLLKASEGKDAAVSELNKRITGPWKEFFSELVLIRQQYLFLRLNRPFIFSKLVHHITSCKEKYGTTASPEGHQSITIIPHVLCSDTVRQLADLSLSETRSLLVAALLQNTLLCTGHLATDVYISGDVTTGSPDFVGNLFDSLFQRKTDRRASSHHATTMNGFVSSFLSFTAPRSEFSVTTPSVATASSLAGEDSHTHSEHCNLLTDARSFATQHNLIGKGGYEKNLDKIQVTNDLGQLTPAACLAFDICKNCSSGHIVLHIAQQQRSFHAQQVMLLVDVHNARSGSHVKQCTSLTSAVGVSLCGGSTNYLSVVDFFRMRQEQMANAMSVKYGEQIKGTQLQVLASQMADAVIKFELLSHDPTSAIKLDVSPGHHELDVRFDGAFVMYNYARISTLLQRHLLISKQGTYPPLPCAEVVDFSLLKDEEEWQLMFLYVLQYPGLVKEAANLVKRGIGVHVTLGLKKICQFLTKFCHAFSSYYGRVKVLLPPEPHLLPLVHARLYLLMCIKQVIHNALTLLAIVPLDQL